VAARCTSRSRPAVIGGTVSALVVTFFLLPTVYYVEHGSAPLERPRTRGAAHDPLGGEPARGDLGRRRRCCWRARSRSRVWRWPRAPPWSCRGSQVTPAGRASAELMEMYLSSPIEAAAQGVRGVRG
jgi:hypothetical protein